MTRPAVILPRQVHTLPEQPGQIARYWEVHWTPSADVQAPPRLNVMAESADDAQSLVLATLGQHCAGLCLREITFAELLGSTRHHLPTQESI